jgi:D-glycero-D-manno-heptose 1,7-bisphosphate phosphatase
MRRFALIDRDGTLVVEKNYLSNPDQLELIPGAAEALKRLQQAGWGLCLITNQSGIARGYFDMVRLESVHGRLAEMLARFGVVLDGIYVCPHAPEQHCDCRKPMPGLILQAAAAHGFNPRAAWVIGDKDVDIGAARAAGARSILVRTGYGRQFESAVDADGIADDLAQAAGVILAEGASPD